jgi:hypothetical protein
MRVGVFFLFPLTFLTQDNLYGTSIMAIRDPGLKGKVVLLDAQPSVLLRLTAFSLQPLIIFLRPRDETAISAVLEPGASPDTATAILKQSQKMQAEQGHLFDYTVDCNSSVADTVRSVARLISAEATSDYWVDTNQELPVPLVVHHSPPAPIAVAAEESERKESQGSMTAPTLTMPADDTHEAHSEDSSEVGVVNNPHCCSFRCLGDWVIG